MDGYSNPQSHAYYKVSLCGFRYLISGHSRPDRAQGAQHETIYVFYWILLRPSKGYNVFWGCNRWSKTIIFPQTPFGEISASGFIIFVKFRIPEEADAADIIQEVFAKIHLHGQKGPEIQDISGWIFQVTRNLIIDFYRKQNRNKTAKSRFQDELENVGLSTNETSEESASTMLARCMQPFVNELPSQYAQALLLTDLGHLTQKEAAQQLGISVSGMKSRVQRARIKLRTIVQECCKISLDSRRRVIDCTRRDQDELPNKNCC